MVARATPVSTPAVDGHNNVYVAAWSVFAAAGSGAPGLDTSGQVWRLRF